MRTKVSNLKLLYFRLIGINLIPMTKRCIRINSNASFDTSNLSMLLFSFFPEGLGVLPELDIVTHKQIRFD